MRRQVAGVERGWWISDRRRGARQLGWGAALAVGVVAIFATIGYYVLGRRDSDFLPGLAREPSHLRGALPAVVILVTSRERLRAVGMLRS